MSRELMTRGGVWNLHKVSHPAPRRVAVDGQGVRLREAHVLDDGTVVLRTTHQYDVNGSTWSRGELDPEDAVLPSTLGASQVSWWEPADILWSHVCVSYYELDEIQPMEDEWRKGDLLAMDYRYNASATTRKLFMNGAWAWVCEPIAVPLVGHDFVPDEQEEEDALDEDFLARLFGGAA